MKISQLINENHWVDSIPGSKPGTVNTIVNHDNMYYTDDFYQSQRKSTRPESTPRTEPPVGRIPITRKDMVKEYIHYHPKLKRGAKIVAGTAALGGAAYIGKKIHDRRKAAKVPTPTHKEMLVGKANEYGNKAKSFVGQHGKKVAAGTLAALGAGVGVKALLKYLRKKKQS